MTVTYDTSRVTLVDHPLVQHKLSILRDKSTGTNQFRQLVRELALFDGYEAMRDLPMEDVEVETPITTATFKELAGKKLAIVPILRAGLGMVDGILDLVPSARVGHIGMERDEVTHEPHEYYCKMPKDIDQRICLVVDPMLATGGSAEMAISYLRERGVKDIRMLCIVAAPEGLKSLTAKDSGVHIYTCAIDDHLNEAAYIVPGLGDAGDRIYGTLLSLGPVGYGRKYEEMVRTVRQKATARAPVNGRFTLQGSRKTYYRTCGIKKVLRKRTGAY